MTKRNFVAILSLALGLAIHVQELLGINMYF